MMEDKKEENVIEEKKKEASTEENKKEKKMIEEEMIEEEIIEEKMIEEGMMEEKMKEKSTKEKTADANNQESMSLSKQAYKKFDEKIKSMEKSALLLHLSCIKNDLINKLECEEKCWRCEVFKSGFSKSAPNLKKRDLSVNVFFGGFTEKQSDLIVSKLLGWFPSSGIDFITKVIFPEALTLLSQAILKLSYCEAESYLEFGGQYHVQELQKNWEKQQNKRCKPTKTSIPSKKFKHDHTRKQPCEEDECKIVKERKSDVSLLSKMKTPNYQLNENDEDVIIKNGLLTDIHIGKAQNLLKQQFPSMEGLQATTLGMVQQFDVMKGKFIQVLHTGANHWICISNIHCNQNNAVKLYDSMYSGISNTVKKQIASLLYLQSENVIEISIEPVTQQTNGYDCGIFAIAFATSLCYGQDPSKITFKRRNIRSHLWNCFTKGKMHMFPSVPRMSSPEQTSHKVLIPIYCRCRLPYVREEDDMVECVSCQSWFHKHCLDVPELFFKKAEIKWKCNPHCGQKK